MKWIRIFGLLIAVLAAMRGGSWVLGWILAKFVTGRVNVLAVLANVAAFGLFTFLLVINLLPGESLDMAAFLFGLAVFTVCCWIDLHWRPWRRER